jgi:hypothetical protein
VSGLQYVLTFTAAVVYLALLFFCGVTCFRKGHMVLGILGIFLPLLWLIGAVLPARSAATA